MKIVNHLTVILLLGFFVTTIATEQTIASNPTGITNSQDSDDNESFQHVGDMEDGNDDIDESFDYSSDTDKANPGHEDAYYDNESPDDTEDDN